MKSDEAEAAARLLARVFDRCIAPRCSERGRHTFRVAVQPGEIRARMEKESAFFVALEGGQLHGVLEVRGNKHVALLFVDVDHQRRGAARALLSRACAHFSGFPQDGLTVHASPNSVAAYRRLGFVQSGPEQVKNGVRFTPMIRTGISEGRLPE